MTKNLLFLLPIFLIGNIFAQTSVPGGAVSGTWNLAGSPYQIQGSIQIPNGSTLTIDPGVTVIFQSNYQLQVNGRLLAIGTQIDSITFTAANTSLGWNSIRFPSTANTNDTSKIIFCKLEYGKATGSSSLANGGALNFTNFSKAIVTRCSIINCSANGDGGGIYCSSSSPIISYNTIANNTSGSYGGGIWCSNNSSPTFSNNTISGCRAVIGGNGIYWSYNSNSSISNNTIINNITDGGFTSGAGIYFESNSNSTISNNIISNNTTGLLASGGGIYFGNNSNSTISHNTISHNTATPSGGGIYWSGNSNSSISNNVISNNIATNGGGGTIGLGGGIYCSNNSSNIINNTISNNIAAMGGGVYCSSSSPVFLNCILWGNIASDLGDQVYLLDEPSDPNFYYCDVMGGSAAFELNGNFYTGTYSNNINIDPLFVAPSTGNWSLQCSSPCINAGDPVGTYPATDIAGNPRVSDGRIDMGAYEFTITIPTITVVGATTFCQGGSVTLTSSSATGNLWTPGGATTQSVIVNTSGSYSVTACFGTSMPITVTVNPSPSIPIITAGGATTFCQGESVMLTSSSATGNVWSPGNATTQSISANMSGSYTVTLTDVNGCTSTSTSTVITVNPLPIVTAGDANGCEGSAITLLGTPAGGTWSVSNPYTGPDSTYTYSFTDLNGCSGTSATSNINVGTDFPISITQNGDTLYATNAANYQWYYNDTLIPGATNQSYVITESGYYSVITISGGCSTVSNIIETSCICVGINEADFTRKISIYPNPSIRSFTIETTLSVSTSIQTDIKNTLGQIVYTFKENAMSGLYKRTIDVNLGQGIYYLTLQTNEGFTTKKIEVVK